MTEAEAFFKRFFGSKWGMWRDETELYERYESLHVPKQYEEQWRQELLDDLFTRLTEPLEDSWSIFSRVLELLRETDTKRWENLTRLLYVMETFPALDQRQRILVIETMAGHDDNCSNGGVALFRLFGDLMPQMKKVMEEIIGTFDPAQVETSQYGVFDRERYDCAVRSYRNSLTAPLTAVRWHGGLSADWKRYLWAIVIFCVVAVLLLGSGSR